MRRGVTLPEVVSVLALAGILMSIAVPPLVRALDRGAVRGAADRYAVIHETARQFAVARARPVRIELDTSGPLVFILLERSGAVLDTLAIRPLGRVRLSASRTGVRFGPQGFALGLSNSRLVFARGAQAETLTVSRTGRLKRGLLTP